MGRIEQRLELTTEPEEKPKPVGEGERGQLLALAEQLFAPELTLDTRLEIAIQMRSLLNGHQADQVDWIPPPVHVLADAEIA
jgi:hypothetical protein